MNKYLGFLCVLALLFAFCSCGGSEEPSAYSPSDITVEAIDDSSNVYHVIYDIDASDTEVWSGHFTDPIALQTAVDGIKECITRDDWTDTSVVYGEDTSGTNMYSYGDDGMDGNYDQIKFFQVGIYDKSYNLQGELQ